MPQRTARHTARSPAPHSPTPPMHFSRRRFLPAAWPYLASAILAAIIAATALHLWRPDAWRFPLQYCGADYFFYLACSKTIRQTGWFFGNPLLGAGAPGGMNMLDYPLCDDLNLLGIKLANLCTGSFVTALTLFYFLGFPLAALTATAALRRLKFSRPASAAAATLYALAPYHFFRMEHVFLAFYIMLPPALGIAIRLAEGEEFPLTDPGRHRKFLKASLILLATVSTGIYYSFFTGFFIAVGGALSTIRARQWNRLIPTAGFLVVILIGILLNTAPNLYQRASVGNNPDAVRRLAGESEVYALRLTYLLLPVVNDRVPPLAAITRTYDDALAPTEARLGGVGLLTAAGIVLLIAVAIVAGVGITPPKPLPTLAALAIAGILLATVSGFGAIFALLVNPDIRSWNRMSICLAFFSLVALCALFDRFVVDHPSRWRNPGFIAALLALLAASIFEQIPLLSRTPADQRLIADRWNSDDRFVRDIESTVGPDAAVFQLPYVAFPESPPYGRMVDYDLFRGYFHSDTLSWSYGVMRGRKDDQLLLAVASLPVPQMLSTLRQMKFDGIYIDTFCDLPNFPDLVEQLRAACPYPSIVSDDPDHRLLFFPLTPPRP